MSEINKYIGKYTNQFLKVKKISIECIFYMNVIFCHFKALEGFFLPMSFVVFTVETMLNVALLHCRLYCRDNCCNIEKSIQSRSLFEKNEKAFQKSHFFRILEH